MDITYSRRSELVLSDLTCGRFCRRREFDLRLAAEELGLSRGFERLISLDDLEVKLFPHQEQTVLRVLRHLRGRAVLADEVGLGKTIEAGVVLREYLIRGIVKRALILVPASLVNQWWEEMTHKFRLHLAILGSKDDDWSGEQIIISSIDMAKRPEKASVLSKSAWDMVIVDEAHKLKNKRTVNWQFVNGLQKKFLLLLTATPIQNNLQELYNLVTLLRPGQLDTYQVFRQRFAQDRYSVRNSEKLRQLLEDVMVRTTRRKAMVAFPRREVQSVSLDFFGPARKVYEETVMLARSVFASSSGTRDLLSSIVLLREATSSTQALIKTLTTMSRKKRWTPFRPRILHIKALAETSPLSPKDQYLAEVLTNWSGKVLVFTEFRATQEHLKRYLSALGHNVVVYHGQMTPLDKDRAIADFRNNSRILISTEAGGEGRNLQFCHMLINYDLPWNPMRVEQRIGRVHRIGQSRTVHVLNLVINDTIEDYVLFLLERKIGLFRRVIGELDAILSGLNANNLELEIGRIALSSVDNESLARGFDALGRSVGQAVRGYEKTLRFNDFVLGETIGIEEPEAEAGGLS